MKQTRKIALHEITGGNATHLKVELYYNKGGMNYFTSNNEERGLYLSASPVALSKGDRYSTETYSAFSGTKKLVKPMTRFNQKTLDEFVPDTDDIKTLVIHVLEKNGMKLVTPEQ